MVKNVERYDAIVIGAGAAGLMCAAIAGQRGRRVLLLDHAEQPGKKILISGGGRCNFTNILTKPECFLSANPHFAKSALGRYQPEEFIALVERYEIAWHEKTLGQLFCDGSAKQIVAMLLEECAKGQVDLRLGEQVSGIQQSNDNFTVTLRDTPVYAESVVLATGGPSIPKMGATGFAYEVGQQFGLEIISPRPALVPLTLGDGEADLKELRGVSSDVVAHCGKARFREAFLFTHRGLSGPAVLQVSSYWDRGQSITFDLTPDYQPDWLVEKKKEKPKAALRTALADLLPSRFAQTLSERFSKDGILVEALGAASDKSLREIEATLRTWTLEPTGTEGYAKAEVTAGGISTAELSSRTMQAKSVPGLYFIGECVDVTGWLGGYNFQWAWASGVAAGEAI
ncbi:MAG: NAD(P)/FAD-dependent oxidoreductase [Pseudomonadota bacterium]